MSGVGDIRISDGVFDHPKMVKLENKLTFLGIKSIFRIWHFAAKNHTDGKLTKMDIEDIAISARWPIKKAKQLVDTLTALRLLDLIDGTYCIHNWKKHNSWASDFDKRSEHARKMNAKRWGKDDNKKTIPKDVPQDSSKDATSIHPSFPLPSSPYPSLQEDNAREPNNDVDDIQAVLAFLSEKLNCEVERTLESEMAIGGQLRAGKTFEDFKAVTILKIKEWYGDEKMKKFLRPSTLFGKKMDSYLKEVPTNNFSKPKGLTKKERRARWVNSIPERVLNENRDRIYTREEFVFAYDEANKTKNTEEIDRLKSILRHQSDWFYGVGSVSQEDAKEPANPSRESTKKLIDGLQNTPDDSKGLASLEEMASNLK